MLPQSWGSGQAGGRVGSGSWWPTHRAEDCARPAIGISPTCIRDKSVEYSDTFLSPEIYDQVNARFAATFLHHLTRVRITFITQWFDPEPGAVRGLPLASWLVARGHCVEVVTGFPNYPHGRLYPGYTMRIRQRENIDGVAVTRLPIYPSHDRSAMGRLANYGSFALTAATIGLALASPSDVAYVYHPPATVGLPALLWKHLRRTPFVYHIADIWPESVTDSGMIGPVWLRRAVECLLNRWCRRLYRAAGAISVLSPGFKELLVERGADPAKIDVIYNWTDESIFHPEPRRGSLARELGLNGKFNVVYAGNLGPFQSLDTAVRAAARLSHIPNFQLVFIGSGLEEQALKDLVASLRLDNVRFVGQRAHDEMGAVSSLADAMLVSLRDIPIFRSTIPSKTQVAMAMGRPVVMAVSGDSSRLVTEAGAGLICPPGDEQALAAAFTQLYEAKRIDLDAMGARGRSFYLRELSLERGAERTEALLRKVADKSNAEKQGI